MKQKNGDWQAAGVVAMGMALMCVACMGIQKPQREAKADTTRKGESRTIKHQNRLKTTAKQI